MDYVTDSKYANMDCCMDYITDSKYGLLYGL